MSDPQTSQAPYKPEYEELSADIKSYDSLTAYLSLVDTKVFPKHLRKKLDKFMGRYDKIYELLQDEGIYFDYS